MAMGGEVFNGRDLVRFCLIPPLAKMQAMAMSSVAVPRVAVRNTRFMGQAKGLVAKPVARMASSKMVVKAANDQSQVIQPLNGDPFIGMLETPVTSSPLVAGFLSNLPAYRSGVSPVLRGTEIGLAHGFLLVGPFIKLGPLRDSGAAELAGCLSGAGLVGILAVCLSIYGSVSFQGGADGAKKTLTGRELPADALQSAEGWTSFTSGWLVGGLSGVAWGYICTQILPFYR